MGGYHGAVYNPKCEHGVSRYTRCADCDAEREANDLAERRRVNEPAQVILDAIARRQRWFDVCVFCTAGKGQELVRHVRHDHDCTYRLTMDEAKIAYGLHLVRATDPGEHVQSKPND